MDPNITLFRYAWALRLVPKAKPDRHLSLKEVKDSGLGLLKGSYDWLVRRVKYNLNSYFSTKRFKHRRSERICNEETTRQRERESHCDSDR
jgi:hypothetical protein